MVFDIFTKFIRRKSTKEIKKNFLFHQNGKIWNTFFSVNVQLVWNTLSGRRKSGNNVRFWNDVYPIGNDMY